MVAQAATQDPTVPQPATRPSFLHRVKLWFAEWLVAFAVRILLDRIANDFIRLGWTRSPDGMWSKEREQISPFDPVRMTSMHEANAVRALVNTALSKIHPGI